MDQLKEILRQAIKYRFWIAVGVSALLPIIAYLVGSGPVKAAAEKQTKDIKDADSGVKTYASGVAYNNQYKPIIDEKTAVLTKDVNASHRKLFARQAPLLTWPNDRVAQKFEKWGRKWPEDVDGSVVQLAIIEYIEAYPKFVTQVYKTFNPFDPAEGTGVVSAPPEDVLLGPAQFDRTNPPNDLAKIWGAQERLWVQRTLLQVVADVNKGATNWDGAIVKQINQLEVGDMAAQDQVSIAKGETLEEIQPITDPKNPPPAEDTSAAGAGGGMEAMMGRQMAGGMGMGMGAQKSQSVFHIKTDSTQFQILPVQMTVLVDQDHVQDFLVALENSPMAIQVMEFDLQKPNERVTKPEKGQNMGFGGMGMMGMMMGRGMRMGEGTNMTGFGGMASMMRGMMGGGMMRNMEMSGMLRPGMAGMGGGTAERKGVDTRSKDRSKERAEEKKKFEEQVHQSLHDPYYNILEVSIYGQARFYNAPPAETAPEPSLAAGSEATAEPAKAEGGEPAKAEAAKTESAKAEAPGAEATKPAATGDEPKKDAGANKEEAPTKSEPAKSEAPKAEPPAPKAEAPATKTAPEAPASKPAAPSTDTPKK